MKLLFLAVLRSSSRWRAAGRNVWRTCLIALWLTASLTGAATAQIVPPSKLLASAWWQDLAGQASLREAQAQTYTPFEGMFSQGYSQATHWIRLTLAASEQPIGLRLSPVWLDEITLHDPAQPGMLMSAGDRHPLGLQNVQQVLGYSFVLPGTPQPRDIWLQLRSTSSHRLAIEAMPAFELPAVHNQAIVWSSIYAAVLVLMLLALISVWWVQREPVLGVYLLRHGLYSVYAMLYIGLPGLLLPAQWVAQGWLDIAFTASVVALLPVGLWFDITLLTGYKPQRHLLLALKCVALTGVAVVGLLLVGQTRLSLQITVQLMLVSTLLVYAAALSSQPAPLVEQLMAKKVMIGYYTLVLSSLLLGLLGVLGWKQPQFWSQYLLILHGLFSGLVMTVILFVRGQRQFRQSQHMAWQLHKTQQEMQLEQRRREEQSQFLHMLMHELKTPLSVISLALGTRQNREENLAHAGRAVQDMKAIIDRCVQADQLGQLTLTLESQALELPAMLQGIAQDNPQLKARLELQTGADLPPLQVDPQLLQIVLTNLLDNAARYSDPLTPVQVSIDMPRSEPQQGLRVRVRNTPGLAGWPDEARLFEKYYRSTGAQRDSGSGLGLFLSRQLAQSLGGSLDYTPGPHHVEFTLWIPLSPP